MRLGRAKRRLSENVEIEAWLKAILQSEMRPRRIGVPAESEARSFYR
jgi:hypothetical protein